MSDRSAIAIDVTGLADIVAGLTEDELAAFAGALASDLHERSPAALHMLEAALNEAGAIVRQSETPTDPGRAQ
jgi:1,4-dihydroxy-2-naphthoyl-CoA synthase